MVLVKFYIEISPARKAEITLEGEPLIIELCKVNLEMLVKEKGWEIK